MSGWRRWFLVVAVVASALAPLTAEAYTYPAGGVLGRGQFIGYFEGNWDDCGASVIDGGLGYNQFSNTYTPGYGAVQFTTQVKNLLYGPDGQDSTGAAFLVLSMLGVPGYSAGGSHWAGVGLAKTRYDEWAAQVNYYATHGKVNFNVWQVFPFDGTGSYLNSMYQGRNDCGGPKPPDTKNPDDDAFYTDHSPQARPTITFYNNDGSVFMIKRNCGNPIGPFEPLTDGKFRYDPHLGILGATPAPGGTVIAGSTLDLQAWFSSAGPATPPAPGNMWYLSAYNGAWSGATWLGWSVNPVPPGVNSQMWPFNFTVSNSVPDGTSLCISARVGPHTTVFPAWDYADDTACWTVQNPRFPRVQAENGDVHAGGHVTSASGTCVQDPATMALGFIKGYGVPAGQTASYSQYVVSASSSINNFDSAGGGSNALTLGSSGNYLQVCRPNLVQAAQTYFNAGTGYTTIPAGNFSLNGKSGVYILNGGTLHITGGTISNLVTIVNLGGSIYIDGDVKLDTAHHASNAVPSLGIISSGDILISNAATTVDAYLFSNANIDTCYQGSSSNSACNSSLLVNGFLMSKSMSLRRMGPAGSNYSQIGERIVLNPQIYINPPRLFDASVDNILLEGQGERQPLY